MVNLYFTKMQEQFNEEMIVFQQMILKQLDILFIYLYFNLYLTPCTKTNSKCIMDLNVKYKTIKFLEKNVRENLYYFMLYKKILDPTLKA